MIKYLTDLIDKIKIFEVVNNYYFEFGILQEDEYITMDAKVVDIVDDTEVIVKMPLKEIMYLTENGTLTVPARPILEKTIYWIKERLSSILDDIFKNVIENDWDEIKIENRLREFSIEVENYTRNQFILSVQSNSTLSSILNIEDETKYLYDLVKLKDYIKCRLRKTI